MQIDIGYRPGQSMARITLADGESRNVIIETTADGAKLDWETLVAHQPMDWDEFATKRPEGTSMDFRVYVERDNFFSHEFADSDQWISLRLTALDADETLFGYTKAGSETAMEILDLLNAQQGRATSMILRLHEPEGIQSRRGVVIEDMLSPRWLYVRPPGE